MGSEASFSPQRKGLCQIVCRLPFGSCCLVSEQMVKRTWPQTQKVGLVNPSSRSILS